jgi:DNA-binding Lrp family transcriptional regulator
MLKSELVFLEIFRNAKTQKGIAERLGISLSTVNNAIEPLARIGAIEKRKFGFRLIDKEKALAFWASTRNLEKDIVYKTRAELAVTEIEKLMPSGTVFTGFTAFRLKFKEVPADYSEVYVYANKEELNEIKKRFQPKEGPANLIVLKKEELLKEEKIVSNELMFVDLWNLKEWYAKEFLKALKQKMGLE